MFRQYSLLLLLAVVAHEARTQTASSCDYKDLIKCQARFNDELGLPASYDWKTTPSLRFAVESIYANSTSFGLARVCRAFKIFKTCFTLDYITCVNVASLINNGTGYETGVTVKQAEAYVKFITQFDFACGAGFQVFANSDECMGKVFAASKVKLAKCQKNFEVQTSLDPSQACMYALTAAYCYGDAFSLCGLTGAWWGCEYERTGTGIHYPQCTQNFCSVIAPPN